MSESDQPLAWRLRSIVGEENVLADEPMSEHTTFKVGGPADLFVTPEDPDEVREVLLACDEAGVSRFVMGRGSDLLVSDDGYRGARPRRWPASWGSPGLSLPAGSPGPSAEPAS